MAAEKLTGQTMSEPLYFEQVVGVEGFREARFTLGGRTLAVAVINGLGNAEPIIKRVIAGEDLGYDFIDTPRTKFSVSAGAGYRKLLPQQIVRDDDGNFLERIDGTMAEDVVGKAGVRYQRQLTQSTTLTDNLLVESGSQNTLAQNDITVQVAMTARLALGLGHSVRHNAQPPEGQIETDQLTTVNLVYTLQ